ncbi:MAG: hypothetical protein ACK4S4_13565 [Pyrinomonadaceae bacterium]
MTANDHNNLLGIFFLIKAGLAALVGVFMMLIYAGVGVAMLGMGTRDEDQIVGGVMFVVGLLVGLCVLALAAFFFFTGVKLRRRAAIGRTLGIVASILALLNFPLGTALGIYGLWFLLGDLGRSLYDGGGQGPGFQAPPPPSSWQ